MIFNDFIKSYQSFSFWMQWNFSYILTLTNLINFFFGCNQIFYTNDSHESYQILFFLIQFSILIQLSQLLSNFSFWMQSYFLYLTTLTNLIKFFFLDAIFYTLQLSQLLSNFSSWMHNYHKSYQSLFSVQSILVLVTSLSTMNVYQKLLSLYLSLAEEKIPVSLNFWTMEGLKGEYFFRL